jgi:predicted AAA+ superfamily ATPase
LLKTFHPLSISELNYDFEIEELLQFGMLPQIRLKEDDPREFLNSYLALYLQEEIRQEAVTRNLPAFSRFLKVAAIMNSEVLNYSNISSESAVARVTVQNYFQVLYDTLIGVAVPAYQPKLRVRESTAPKFYLFDTGVVSAASGRLYDQPSREERGHLFETLVLHELRTWQSILSFGGEYHYYRTGGGLEIDFLWVRGKTTIGIEVKSTNVWRSKFGNALNELIGEGVIKAGFGVYLGTSEIKDGKVHVFPFVDFVRKLSAGEILGG